MSSKDGSSMMISDDSDSMKKVSLKVQTLISSWMLKVKVSSRLLAASKKLVVTSTPTHLREDQNSSLLHDEHKNILTKLHTRFFVQKIFLNYYSLLLICC